MKIVKIILLSALYGLVSSSPSSATYYKWSVDIEPDPLGKGEKVTARYSINADAGVSISCQTTEMGIAIDVTSGWKADVSILEIQPKPRLAIDGKELNAEPIKAITGLSENSIAGISANYDSVTSRKIVNAWMNAIYQIAIEDTISAEPLFMNASGSTSAGKKLHDCLEEQEVFSNASHKKRNKDSIWRTQSGAVNRYLDGEFHSLLDMRIRLNTADREKLMLFTLVAQDKCSLGLGKTQDQSLGTYISHSLGLELKNHEDIYEKRPKLATAFATYIQDLKKPRDSLLCRSASLLILETIKNHMQLSDKSWISLLRWGG